MVGLCFIQTDIGGNGRFLSYRNRLLGGNGWFLPYRNQPLWAMVCFCLIETEHYGLFVGESKRFSRDPRFS